MKLSTTVLLAALAAATTWGCSSDHADQFAEDADASMPDDSEPDDGTEPDSNEADSSNEPDDEPDGTEPDDAEPDDTNEPGDGEPDSTEPDGTEPDSTEPDDTNEPDDSTDAGNTGDSSDAGSMGGATTTGDAGGPLGGSGGGSGDGGSGGADVQPCEADEDCNDLQYCNGVETCDEDQGICVPGEEVVCTSDGLDCTVDICNEDEDTCQSIPQDSLCNDDKFCTGVEKCLPDSDARDSRGCVAGTTPTCSDGASCTEDSCDVEADECVHVPDHDACDDELTCTGTESCDPENLAAQAVTGCVEGEPLDCDDEVGCTLDSCTEPGGCEHDPQDELCDDGLFCNGEETCSATGCENGDDYTCPDNDCRSWECSEAELDCVIVDFDSDYCDEEEGPGEDKFCGDSGCELGLDCTGNEGICDDGNPCNGTETCVDSSAGGGQKVCAPGTPTTCDDGASCTQDTCCKPGDSGCTLGECVFTPRNGFCNDLNVCNGLEVCDPDAEGADPEGGCAAGTPLTCTDAYSCTDNRCDAVSGCYYPALSSRCDDDLICNGTERCVPASSSNGTGCIAGTPVTCADDGIECTDNQCVEGIGCSPIPDDSECECGETCDPAQGGCGNFCRIAECQNHVYNCGDCVDDDGDCKVDSDDEHCLGSCDNNEEGYDGNIPGQNSAPCKSDCYFDQDTGAGNDDCYWSHECDILEVAPYYDPEGAACTYDGTTGVLPPDTGAKVPGTKSSCSTLYQTQSSACGSYCGPLTPNGCDCFGCCSFPQLDYTVYLGSESDDPDGCSLDTVDDPDVCRPCTQVPACLNTCEECEICLGKPDLPPECEVQECPDGSQPCGLEGQAQCNDGEYCVTGCCQRVAQ